RPNPPPLISTCRKVFGPKLFAQDLGRGRHIAVRENGDVYVMLQQLKDQKGMAALRDTDQDGKADQIEYYADFPGTGIAIHKGYLYFSSDSAIHRVKLPKEGLLPTEAPELIVGGFETRGEHDQKGFTFDQQGNLYVGVGAPSNACQEKNRTPGEPGMDPCPLLEKFGGVWRYKADAPNQRHPQDGTRYATGIRNTLALDWNTEVNKLYFLQHGRDQLNQFFPEHFDQKESIELPAEEFFVANEGDHFGWPYCYYDPQQNKKVLAPEYGGNGEEVGRCKDFKDPLIGFPAHYAPNDLVFYNGEMFPEYYRNGAFIAFHGSWNRSPEEQQGYQVVFVPFKGENPNGKWFIFANGFKGKERIKSPSDAKARPTGLAIGPDGALYISDSVNGKIWKITYQPPSQKES
ncbi:MAG: sorbosone dehydrogenase, partial [Bacteroidia bacterium]|nr:sorbosone dehydrogenase [Bacteroidia bacterium]